MTFLLHLKVDGFSKAGHLSNLNQSVLMMLDTVTMYTVYINNIVNSATLELVSNILNTSYQLFVPCYELTMILMVSVCEFIAEFNCRRTETSDGAN